MHCQVLATSCIRSLCTIGIGLSLLVAPASAQGFGEELLLNTQLDYQADVDLVDMDGDGDLDYLTTRLLGRQTMWSENLGGGSFSGLHTVGYETTGGLSRSVRGADLDGDGDMDVVTTRFSVFTTDPVGWYENLGGETFSDYQLLDTSIDSGTLGRVGDMDGDGDLDVVFAGDELHPTWIENLGGGSFAPGVQLATWNVEARALELADLDGDGKLDVVWVVPLSSRVFWVRGLGAGSFAPRETITASIQAPVDLQVVDLDSDGDLDLVIASQGTGEIVWLPNIGPGLFGPKQVISTGQFTVKTILAADIDGDGDIDVLSGMENPGELSLHENTGGAIFNARVTIQDELFSWIELRVADMDGDGDLDPVIATSISNRWLPNLGGGTFGDLQLLGLRIWGGEPVDFDGDGDLDLVGGDQANAQVLLAENLGGGRFTETTPLISMIPELRSSAVLDVDSDGDLDLIVGTGSFSSAFAKVEWHENQGGVFGPGQQIFWDLADGGASIQVADMDGDGDGDILLSYRAFLSSNSSVRWLRSNGAGGFADLGPAQASQTPALTPADLDGDGDLDVVTFRGSFGPSELVWHENLGSSLAPAQLIESYPPQSIGGIDVADFDGDGNQDILIADMVNDELQLIRSLGAGNFDTPRVIGASLANARVVLAQDLDLDGDPDAMVLSYAEAQWFENLGGGGYGPPQPITHATGAWSMSSIRAADLNGDGDLDLIKWTTFGAVLQSNDLRFGDGYCLAAEPNSSGAPATISAMGSLSVSANNVSLLAGSLPPNQFGYFLVADGTAFMPFVGGSQGTLCVGGNIGRLNRNPSELFNSGAAGTATVQLDLTDVPTPTGPVSLLPGDTRYFQVWFRDVNPATTSNFSSGLRIEFE